MWDGRGETDVVSVVGVKLVEREVDRPEGDCLDFGGELTDAEAEAEGWKVVLEGDVPGRKCKGKPVEYC